METPILVPRELYIKDLNSLKIDVVEIRKANINFNVERVYILSTQELESISGNHAHLNQSQIIFLYKGQADLKLTNILGETFYFNLKEFGVYIPNKHWIELKLFPQSIVFCLASKNYNELHSVYNFDDFLKLSLAE